MRKMTEDNLLAAFAGESQAHMKYKNFAEQAKKEGLANVARLFQAIAYAEKVHASNHLRALGKVKDTVANLGAAIEGETYEVEEMYAAFTIVAQAQGEKQALRTMNWALETEKVHAVMYDEARKKAKAKQDIESKQIWVCDLCGYTGYGEVPDECPICKAKKEKFSKF